MTESLSTLQPKDFNLEQKLIVLSVNYPPFLLPPASPLLFFPLLFSFFLAKPTQVSAYVCVRVHMCVYVMFLQDSQQLQEPEL